MYPNPRGPPPQPGQPFKFTVTESCDRVKEEFSFLQAQYHSLKMDCEKLAQEKTEMQRHYVMYYEMSYGLNVEMHKQTEIAKRLNAICAQVIPFLSQEHQQQVAAAVERAKQVTMTELNAIIGKDSRESFQAYVLQQMQAQHLPHAHAPPIPMTPHPGGLQPPLPPSSSAAGLLALSANSLSSHSHSSGAKDEKGAYGVPGYQSLKDDRHRTSTSPNDRDKYSRSRSPDMNESKKRRVLEEKAVSRRTYSPDSDGEKSDQDLVVDVANEDPTSPLNGERSPRENGPDKGHKKDGPVSPRSEGSSHASTPSSKHKEHDKPSTPVSKSATPTSSGNATPGPSSGHKAVAKAPPPPQLGRMPYAYLPSGFLPYAKPYVSLYDYNM